MIRYLPLLLLAGATSPSPFTVGDRGYSKLQAAVDAIGDGEGTVIVAPGVHRDCAVQVAGRITFRAATPGAAIFEAVACEEKAGLVLRGRRSHVDGLVFRGYAVPDKNGAGIRTESGDLLVTNSAFRDSEMGVTGGARLPNGPRVSQRVTIDRSTFSGLGRCRPDENCSHSVYLWTGTATITRSRFERGRGGHYVKLRAPEAFIGANSFDDSAGTMTSYAIDLPEGAMGAIEGNVFVQGAAKDNPGAMIAVRPEFRTYPSTGLRVADNDVRLAPGAKETTFVADWSGERLAVGANRLGAGVVGFGQR
jgi:hypothetical protein